MIKIKVASIVFTDSCIKNMDSVNSLITTFLQLLKNGNFKLIYIQEDESELSNSFNKDFKIVSESKQVITCKKNRDNWQISNLYEIPFFLEKQTPIEVIVSFVQKKFAITPCNTITIGINQEHFALKSRSILHFHVGEQAQFKVKVSGVIPITGQYEKGVENIITYFINNKLIDNAFNYSDLIEFVNRSKVFFSSELAAKEIMQKHNALANGLKERFQDDIIAIFGTGYPFYLSETDTKINFLKTPQSILDYFDIQASYFSKKAINENFFINNMSKKFTLHELEKCQIHPKRNNFDIYKYESLGYSPPEFKEENIRSLEEYYSSNCFDIMSDIWPCYFCASIQNSDIYPNQLVQKDTNISCLQCSQTSFMLRNIMGCSSDIDIIVVVNKDKFMVAEKIKQYIYNIAPFHFYDTNFHAILNENDGPVDLFVTEESDILHSFDSLLLDNWENSYFDSIALWPPSRAHRFKIGLDFVLAFDPVYFSNPSFIQSFLLTRQKFALRNRLDEVLNKLTKASFYTEQLLSNEEIVEVISKKYKIWSEMQLDYC